MARALSRKVWLKSGGYLVIDHTEAMTVIDVNTGRFVGKRDQEETILRNNLEAAKEVAYQVKLRGIGGIIIVDFIDMEREKNRDKVYHALVDAMASDKARTRISRISDLGLIEISRERVREDLLRSMSEPCRYCEGRGYTKSPTTVAYEIFREIRKIGRSNEQQKIVVGVHPSVAGLLQDEERPGLEALERENAAKILVMPDEQLHLEQYDLVVMKARRRRSDDCCSPRRQWEIMTCSAAQATSSASSLEAWLKLRAIDGVGDSLALTLVRELGTPDAVLRATRNDLGDRGCSPRLIEAIVRGPDLDACRRIARGLEATVRKHVEVRTASDPRDPRRLLTIPY